MLFPLKNAFAYSGGLLNGKSMDVITSNGFKNITNSITDNNLTTGVPLTNYISNDSSLLREIYYEFNGVANINRIYYSTSNTTTGTFTAKFYNENNILISTVELNKNYTGFLNVSINRVKKVQLTHSSSTHSIRVYEFDVFGEVDTSVNYKEISNLSSSVKNNHVNLTWENPISTDFQNSKIYKNNKLIATLDKNTSSYNDEGLDFDTTYNYKITSVYSDLFETTGVSTKVTTEEILKIKELEAETQFNRVDLSWRNPNNSEFKHINIYRDKLEEQTALQTFFSSEKVKSAASTKIFETNGTYFNDLTVEPETKYGYTLSITDTNGKETAFTDITVNTPIEPPPILKDGSLEEQENGDYKFSWTEPTNGKVRIVVGGKEYAMVEAADKQIIIPKSDMKYTPIGDPDVIAIPISETGKEGGAVKPPSSIQEIELPFGVTDLLKSGSGLLWWIAPFVLLGLSFLLVPKLRNLIVKVVRGKKEPIESETERRTKAEYLEKEKIESVKTEKEPRESKKDRVEKQGKKLRSVRVRERQTKEPKDRRERALKEPKISRISRETRQPRQSSNRTREAREGRQSERVQRMPREPRQGR